MRYIKKLPFMWLIFFSIGAGHTQTLTLYVDTKTKQVYTEPGKNRVKLGDFRHVEERAEAHPSTPREKDTGAREPLEIRRKAIEEELETLKQAGTKKAEKLEAKETALEEELRELERELEADLEQKEDRFRKGTDSSGRTGAELGNAEQSAGNSKP